MREVYELVDEPIGLATGEVNAFIAYKKYIQWVNVAEGCLIRKITLKELLQDRKSHRQSRIVDQIPSGEQQNICISCVEYKCYTLFVGLEKLSILIQLEIRGENMKFTRRIQLQAPTFLRMERMIMDSEGRGLVLRSQHECQSDRQDSPLKLGAVQAFRTVDPSKSTIQSFHSYLNLNTLSYDPVLYNYDWNCKRYIQILSSPWNSDLIYYLPGQIVSKNWQQHFEHLSCLAYHPSGLLLSVCFRDCFKIFAITDGDLTYTYQGDSVKECKTMCYSPQGNHLAVASLSHVNIYDAYTCQRLYVLSQAVPVKYLKYEGTGLHCLSKNKKFQLYEMSNSYSVTLSFQPREYLPLKQKDTPLDMVQYDYIYDVFFVVRQHELKFFTTRGTIQTHSHIFPWKITCLQICRPLRVLFIGNEHGEIISFCWPNSPYRIDRKWPKIRLHDGAVTIIRISNDLQTLTSVSSDGSLYHCQLRVVDRLQQIHPSEILFLNRGTIGMDNLLKCRGLVLTCLTSEQQLQARVKQMEEEMLNQNFMRPEEEEKLRTTFRHRLNFSKQEMRNDSTLKLADITIEHSHLRRRIQQTKAELDRQEIQHVRTLEKENTTYARKLHLVIEQRNKLENSFYQKQQQFKKELKLIKQQYEEQLANLNQQNSIQIETAENKVNTLSQKSAQKLTKIKKQLNWMENQFRGDREQTVREEQKEIDRLKSIQFQFSSNNNRLEKQIRVLTMRVAELKESLHAMEFEVNEAERKACQKLKSEVVQHCSTTISNYNQQMSNIEYQFITSTKVSSKHNRDINVMLQMYRKGQFHVERLEQREKQLNKKHNEVLEWLVRERKLQFQYDKREKEMNLKENELKGMLKDKKMKSLELVDLFRSRKKRALVMVQQNKSTLSEESLTRLRMILTDQTEKAFRKTEMSERKGSLQTLQNKIIKASRSHQRIKHTVAVDLRATRNHFERAYDQNQDLIEYLNSLTYENKCLRESAQGRENNISVRRRHRNMPEIQVENGVIKVTSRGPLSSSRNLLTTRQRLTPFQKYHDSSNSRFKQQRYQTQPFESLTQRVDN